MRETRYEELKRAEKGALLSIVAYLLISFVKLLIGNMAGSEALWADFTSGKFATTRSYSLTKS